MKTLKGFLAAVCGVLGLLCPGAAAAEGCPYSPEEFRFELGLFAVDLEALGSTLEQLDHPADEETRLAAADLEAAFATMSDEELLRLCDVLNRYPQLREAPATTSDLLRSLAAAEGSGGDSRAEVCGELSRELYLVLFIANELLETLEIIADAVCNATECPLYLPTPALVCVPSPPECSVVCPITIGIAKVLRIVSESFLIEDNYCGLANHYSLVADEFIPDTERSLTSLDQDFQDKLIVQLDAAVSTRASQNSLDTLMTDAADRFAELEEGLDDLLTELAAQGDDRVEFQEVEVALAIETELQEGQTGRISGLQLPEAFGGELETVREVVAAAILMTQDAGEEINDALTFFADADDFFNQGNYKDAFANYRLAYQEAASAETGGME